MTLTERKNEARNSLIAEITGYLGGAFVVISLAVFVSERFDDLDKVLRSGLFLALFILLAALVFSLGTSTGLRARLASVLALASSISLTVALATFFEINRAPLAAFVVGSIATAAFFYRNRSELLHLGTAAFLFITSIMAAATIVRRDTDALTIPLAAAFWLALSAIWIYLSFNRKIQHVLGYSLAVVLLFLAIQALFIQDHREISYFVAAITVFALMRLYLIERIWPLLIAPLVIASVSIAELVAATLSGSISAVSGLFIAGALLIATSLFVIRSMNQKKHS
jgi:hypothetical protein